MNASTNAELTLSLNICLQQAGDRTSGWIMDADNVRWDLIPWPPLEWTKFLRTYQTQATEFWTGKFWLISPAGTGDLCWPMRNPTHQCNTWCRFSLKVVDSPDKAHQTIRIAKLAPLEEQEDHYLVCRAYGFRSHSLLYKSDDLLTVTRDETGNTSINPAGRRQYKQRTYLHEVGHSLGLPHIGVMTKNPNCPSSNTNATTCYGTTLREAMDIMGEGESLSLDDAKPWLDRISQHLPGCAANAFKAAQHRVFPGRLTA